MANRAAIAQAVKAQPRVATGGTSAPKAAAGGPGVFNRHPARPGASLGQNQPLAPKPPTAGTALAAPPSPYTPTPWDSQYELSSAAARQKYANTVGGLGLQKTATEQDFGISPGYNDYQANPWSRMALLEQQYQKANRGTTNSMAAAGQLYAGATSNALDSNRQFDAQERDSLEKTYRNKLQELSDQEAAAKANEGAELNEAGWKRLEAAERAPLDSSTAPEAAATRSSGSRKVVREAVSNARSLGRGRRK